MIDIYSLLNVSKEQFRDFPLLANRVIDHQIEKVVNKNIDGLQQVKDRMLVDKGLEIPQQSIGEVIKKVRYFCSKNDDSMDNWSNDELEKAIIHYNSDDIESEPTTKYGLNIPEDIVFIEKNEHYLFSAYDENGNVGYTNFLKIDTSFTKEK